MVFSRVSGPMVFSRVSGPMVFSCEFPVPGSFPAHRVSGPMVFPEFPVPGSFPAMYFPYFSLPIVGKNCPSGQAVRSVKKDPGSVRSDAGSVAVSGLELSKNAQRLSWSANEVDSKLGTIMEDIHGKCVEFGSDGNFTNYVRGANVGGGIKIVNAMLAYGVT